MEEEKKKCASCGAAMCTSCGGNTCGCGGEEKQCSCGAE